MKSVKVIVSVVVVVVLLYTGCWFYQANRLQNRAQNTILDLAGEHDLKADLRSDRIRLGGYPLHISLHFINPKILLQGTEVVRQEGSVDLIYTVLGELKEITTRGKTFFEVPGAQKGSLAGQTRVDFPSDNEFQVISSNLQIALLDGNETQTVTLEKGLISAKDKERENDQHTLSVVVNLQGLEYGYIGQNEPKDATALLQAMNQYLYSKMGKNNFSLKMNVEVPSAETFKKIVKTPLLLLSAPIPSIGFEVQNLNFTNNFQTTHAQASFSLGEDGSKNIKLQGMFSNKSNYTPAYYLALTAVVDELAKVALVIPAVDENTKKLKDLFRTKLAAIKALVPHIDELGTIESDAKFSLECNKQSLNSKFTLGKLELLCNQFGVRLSGNGEYKDQAAFGDLTLDLLKYHTLISDLVKYTNNVISLVGENYHPISESTQKKIFTYLLQISNPNAIDPDSLSISLHFKDDTATVGTMNWQDFQTISKNLWTTIQDEVNPPPPPPVPPTPAK